MRSVLDAGFSSPDAPYARRVAANPALYGLVRTRLEQYADELAPQSPEEAAAAAAAEAAGRRSSRRGSKAAAAPPSP